MADNEILNILASRRLARAGAEHARVVPPPETNIRTYARKHTKATVDLWVSIMNDTAAEYRDRLAATKMLMAYAWGNPSQHVDLDVSGGDGGGRVQVGAGMRGLLAAIEKELLSAKTIDAVAEETTCMDR